jgi:signal transduction histidine kinase
LSNLVGNAVDHMGDALAPEIAVSVACSGELATLRVRDNGVGIAPELHERIFEVDHSAVARNERACHRGLGLAIVRELAEGWRGRAWVESARGGGAAFFVTIPVAR